MPIRQSSIVSPSFPSTRSNPETIAVGWAWKTKVGLSAAWCVRGSVRLCFIEGSDQEA